MPLLTILKRPPAKRIPSHDSRLIIGLNPCSPEALPVEALEEGVGEEVGQHRGGGHERRDLWRGGQGSAATTTTTRAGAETSARG